MIEVKDTKIQEFTEKVLNALSQLEDLNIEQLRKRITGLREILAEFSCYIIRSGLVGITSSGKSSLLNILLGTGEKILKEQAKATTNMITFCSKSDEPHLTIHFEDGRTIEKRGKDVFTEPVSRYTSEDENPQNRYNIKFLKLSLPTFLLDKDIEIADTPGLDAYGLKEHEDLTLREFLPTADLIIYVSSIRSPMKGADRRTLNRIMDADQQVIFVQTCMGSVVEQSNGDGTTVPVSVQLAGYKEAFKKSIEHYPKLNGAPVVQVETALARNYLKSNDLTAWRESGFEEFVHTLKNLAHRLQSANALKNLRMAIDAVRALNNLLKHTVKKVRNKEGTLEEKTRRLEKIIDDLEKIIKDKQEIASKWTEEFNHASLFKKYSSELSRVFIDRYDFNPMHDREFISKAHAIEERIKKIKDDFLDSLDKASDRYREYFKSVDLEIRRKDIQNSIQSDFSLPNVQKKRLSDALGKEGSPTKLSLWKSRSEITDEYIDKQKYIIDLEWSLKLYFEPLLNHLQWWGNSVQYSFVEPLRNKMAALEDDLEHIETCIYYDETQYDRLLAVSNALDELTDDISSYGGSDEPERSYAGYASRPVEQRTKADNRNLFIQLGSRLFGNLFHASYLKCLNSISAKPVKNVVFIGHDYGSQIRFLRHLFRLDNENLSLLLQSKPPIAINVQDRNPDIMNIRIENALSGMVSIYVLSNDFKSLEIAGADRLCEKADVIQLMVDDLHRVGSALTDVVERNLFFDVISNNRDKLLLTYPGGAHFQKERLHIMFKEALAEINKIFSHDKTHWFIYENFEIRYNYFNEYALKIINGKLDIEGCLREWKYRGIPLDEPFTENILREQFGLLLTEQ